MKPPDEKPGGIRDHAGCETHCNPSLPEKYSQLKRGGRRGLVQVGKILPVVIVALTRHLERQVARE